MRALILFILFFSQVSMAQNCPPGLVKTWTQSNGYQCVSRFNNLNEAVEECMAPLNPLNQNLFSSFPLQLYQATERPWWALQGDLLYPNVNYPGVWSYPGIQKEYYPGEGDVFAAKPNVYIDTVVPGKKFSFKFISSEKPHFLATTPVLTKQLAWNGKFESDKFEVDEIFYDYLFYDVRFPKEKMQFENGVCTTREGAIQWMMGDLKSMRYSDISLQDFDEHWRVKIPDYPYYCIYPQYNSQIDPVLPVEIKPEQNTFIRSLYVLVPHKKGPDAEEPVEIPYPVKDPSEFRPGTRIKREIELREWGVAFLGY